jgi:hypothetical protein
MTPATALPVPTTHELKTWPDPFEAVWDGRKPYEVRRNDRNYLVGDCLVLREWDPGRSRYGQRSISAVITYLTPGGQWGLPLDVCVLGIRVTGRTP